MSLQHEVTLRDGTRAILRPIRPSDKERLRRGLALLSPRSRFLRFHTPVVELSDEQLRYLTEVDYHDHMAWVAIDPEHSEEPGMGVARYIRLVDDPTVAEAAITVADAYQGRGLGRVLLRVLGESARASGIDTFRSYVLDENAPMLAIFRRLGARIEREEDGVLRVDLDLPQDGTADEAPATRAVLREAAQGRLPLGMFDPPVWSQRARDAVLKRHPPDEAPPTDPGRDES